MRTRWLAALLAVLLAAHPLPAAAQAARAKVDLRCDAVAIGPTLDCARLQAEECAEGKNRCAVRTAAKP